MGSMAGCGVICPRTQSALPPHAARATRSQLLAPRLSSGLLVHCHVIRARRRRRSSSRRRRTTAADDGVFWLTKAEFFRYFPTLYLAASHLTAFLEE
jgi:hypothetical protein